MIPFDPHGEFTGSLEQTKLRRLVTSGVGASVFSSIICLFIQMAGTVILGRLLTPGDFGIVTMVTAVSMLLMNFGLNGFTEAVVQAERVTHQLLSNLFWINITVGLILTIALSAVAPLLSSLYKEPKVSAVAIAMSATILLSCTSVLHSALLKKAMRFGETSLIEIMSRLAYTAAAISCALVGWGYWALVVAAIAGPLVTNVFAFWYCRWIPALPRRQHGTRTLLHFAVNVYARYCVNYFGMTLDQFLIGLHFNAFALGSYKKAYDLFFLASGITVQRVTMVAVAALSRLRDDPDTFARLYVKALSAVAFVGMGIGAGLSLVGKDVIRVVLGPGWETAGIILTVFGLGTGMMFISTTQAWLHLSLGRADRWFRWGAAELAVNAILFLAALRFGPIGIAGAWATAFWIMVVPALWFAGRPVSLSAVRILGAVWPYTVASAIAGSLCFSAFATWRLAPAGDTLIEALIRIMIVCSVFSLLYLLVVTLLNRGFAEIKAMLQLFLEMAHGRREKVPVAAE